MSVSCGAEKTPHNVIAEQYHNPNEQKIVQAAAELVDHGRAGTLSRIEEIAEFAESMGYTKLGIAYCFGMEKEAVTVAEFFIARRFSVISVRCTVGGMNQSEINEKSGISSVSCNPIMQAEQLNKDEPDLVITMGLCLGHDILFNRYLKIDSTNLIVKDRTTGHDPLKAVRALQEN